LLSRIWKLDLKAKYGQWVVISGATDGIGFEYAREFARRKHSLILLGRNDEKLQKVKNELKNIIQEKNIVTIVCDFEKATIEDYKEVADKIDSLKREIGILINNAGVMYRSPNRLLDQSKKDDWAQISVNCAATVLITRACLSGMVKRKKGLIINLSSTAAYRPLSLMGVYSASKVC
jgi:17beta-estradiol 17-dehydrogenase / very-long-chain 3-oxoacyl-CoA reductase